MSNQELPHPNDKYVKTVKQIIDDAGGMDEFWSLENTRGAALSIALERIEMQKEEIGWLARRCDSQDQLIAKLRNTLDAVAALSTGWVYGHEGVHLLEIHDLVTKALAEIESPNEDGR